MARRIKMVEMNPAAVAEPPPEEAGGEGSESLFDASGDARVRILRRDERTQKMVTHGYMEPTVSEEKVSARFGGGHYRAQLFIPDDTGVPKVKRSRDFDIPGPYKPPAKINTMDEVGPHAPIQNDNPSPSVTTIVGGGDDLMQVLKAGIINTLLEMMKSTKEMNARPTGPDPMMLELLRQQAATQSEMMKFMLTMATKEAPSESKDTLGMLAKMKEIVAPPAPLNGTDPMQMFNTMLETFTRMRDVATDIAPERGDVDPIMGSIPKLVEVVAEQHAMQKEQQARRVAPAPVVGTIAPEVSTLPPQPELAMWQKILRQQSARMVASAAAKHDPDVIAGTAILFAPPAVKEALMLFFHRDETEVLADVVSEIPAMAEHREWLADFIAAAQERLFPDEYTDDDDTPEGEDSEGEK